jgi:hypothetical protein
MKNVLWRVIISGGLLCVALSLPLFFYTPKPFEKHLSPPFGNATEGRLEIGHPLRDFYDVEVLLPHDKRPADYGLTAGAIRRALTIKAGEHPMDEIRGGQSSTDDRTPRVIIGGVPSSGIGPIKISWELAPDSRLPPETVLAAYPFNMYKGWQVETGLLRILLGYCLGSAA